MRILYVGDINGIDGIDGPNSRVHPRDYKEWLNKQSDLCYICANNPILANLFPAHKIIVIYKDKQSKLSDHPDWQDKSQYIYPGEFWSAVGEKWVSEL